MTKPGRKPTPTALKKLRGNPGRRPITNAGPAFKGSTTPPAHLDRLALNEWYRLRKRLNQYDMLTPADRAAFAAYCTAYSKHVRAEEALAKKKNPFGYKTPGGVLRPWPEEAASERALAQMHKFGIEFGLTPSARSRLDLEAPKKETDDDDFLFGPEDQAPPDECETDAAN